MQEKQEHFEPVPAPAPTPVQQQPAKQKTRNQNNNNQNDDRMMSKSKTCIPLFMGLKLDTKNEVLGGFRHVRV